jgi:hypothetical protein
MSAGTSSDIFQGYPGVNNMVIHPGESDAASIGAQTDKFAYTEVLSVFLCEDKLHEHLAAGCRSSFCRVAEHEAEQIGKEIQPMFFGLVQSYRKSSCPFLKVDGHFDSRKARQQCALC